ncbi:LppU/SCO3897 family protein [Streptodolium elevatio]
MTQPPHGRNPFSPRTPAAGALAAEAPAAETPAAEAPDALPAYYAELGGGPVCAICGAYPAVEATLRSHVGLVLLMSTHKEKAVRCRDCGLAAFRDAQEQTLKKGWWSAWSLLVGPLVLVTNLRARDRALKLDTPRPGAPRPPLSAGRPLHRRPWAATLVVVPLLLVAMLLTIALSSSDDDGDTRGISEAVVGDCLRNFGTESAPRVSPVDCADPEADYTLLVRLDGATSAEGCPSVAVATYAYPGPQPFVLCMIESGGIMFTPGMSP